MSRKVARLSSGTEEQKVEAQVNMRMSEDERFVFDIIHNWVIMERR